VTRKKHQTAERTVVEATTKERKRKTATVKPCRSRWKKTPGKDQQRARKVEIEKHFYEDEGKRETQVLGESAALKKKKCYNCGKRAEKKKNSCE